MVNTDRDIALRPLFRRFGGIRTRRRAVQWLSAADLDVETREAVRIRLVRALSTELSAPHTRAAMRAAARFGFAVLACVLAGSLLAAERSGAATWAGIGRVLLDAVGITGGVLLVTLPIWPAALWISYQLDGWRRVRACAMVEALGELRDAQSAGTLARAFRVAGLREAAAKALCQTLPGIGPDDGGADGWQEQDAMARAVRRADPELAGMLLTALAELGDSHALMVLRQLGESGRAPLDPAVRAQLTATISAIEMRLQAGAQQQNLLRSSDSAAQDKKTLPRVLGGARIEPEVLDNRLGR